MITLTHKRKNEETGLVTALPVLVVGKIVYAGAILDAENKTIIWFETGQSITVSDTVNEIRDRLAAESEGK